MSQLNIALIGCGFFGQQLSLGFTKAGANLLGVTDVSFPIAQELANKFNTQAYPDTQALLAGAT